MAEPSLVALFGAGAVQDATSLTIDKADLVAVGLTASANNSAEALFTAIMKTASATLTPENQDLNPDQSITIEDGFPSIIQRNNQNYRQNTKTISFQKVDTQSEIDPDDYDDY
jgi:hypothetical protein